VPVRFDLLSNLVAAGSSTLGATVMRTHVRIQTHRVGGLSDALFLGIRVAGRQDVLSDADMSRDEDWALLDLMLAGCGVNTVTMGLDPTPSGEGFNIDLRSRRRVEELGQSWFMYLRSNLVGTDYGVSFWARTLIALP